MEMEYGKAFTFLPEDADWLKKWGIAGLITLIPVIGQILVLGYGVEVTRRVIRDEAVALPEWSDFAGYLRKGIMAVVISLVYLLPLILVAGCAVIPIVVLSLAQNSGNGNESLGQITGLISTCVGCFATVYGIFASLLIQSALGQFAATDQINEALRVGEVLQRVRAKPGMYLIVVLLSGLTGLLLSALGGVACGIGAFWGAAYATLVSAHLTGQAQRYVAAASQAE